MSSPAVPHVGATIVPPARSLPAPEQQAAETAGLTPNEIIEAFATTGAVTHNYIPPPSPLEDDQGVTL